MPIALEPKTFINFHIKHKIFLRALSKSIIVFSLNKFLVSASTCD